MAKKSTSSDWAGDFLKSEVCKGAGIVVEGVVEELRVHSLFLRKMKSGPEHQADRLPQRYSVVVVKGPKAYERVFQEKRGHQVELDYQQNDMLPDGHKNKVSVATLDADALLRRLGGCPLPDPKILPARLNDLHPKSTGVFEFWIDVENPKTKQLEIGSQVRIMSLGDSIIVDAFDLMTGVNLFKNAEQGAELSSGWIGNIAQHADPPKFVPDDREGVDEDEWSD